MSTERFNYIFDSIAENKITEIFRYIKENLCNHQAAKSLYDCIMEEIERLRNFPDSGEIRYEDIRRVPIQNYWLYYIPLHDIKLIYIVNITHSSQKFENEKPM